MKEVIYTDRGTITLTYDSDRNVLGVSLNAPVWKKDTTVEVDAWKEIEIKNICDKSYFEQTERYGR